MFRGHTLGAPTKHCAFEGHRFKLQKFFAITEASSGRTLRSFSECTKAGNFRRMKLIKGSERRFSKALDDGLSLRKRQNAFAHRFILFKCFAEQLKRQPERGTFDLDEASTRHRYGTRELQRTSNSLMADQTDICCYTVGGGCDYRRHF
jgi:hypothetical protein